MTEVVITGAVRTAIGTFGGGLAGTPPSELAARCVAEALRRAGTGARGRRPRGLRQRHPHRAAGRLHRPRRRHRGRPPQGGAGDDGQPPLRQRPAGDRLGRTGDPARRCRHGRRRRRREHEPRAAPPEHRAHRAADGRRRARRLHARRAERPVRQRPYGRHRRERRRALRRFPRRSRTRSRPRARRVPPGRSARAGSATRSCRSTVQRKRETVAFDTDEHPKPTSAEDLAKLRPAFSKTGSVTAGNASGLNDGAAALVLSSAARGRARRRDAARPDRRLRPCRRRSRPRWAWVRSPAVRRLLERTGLRAGDFDVIESNEAFAAQACAVSRALDLDPGRR